MNLEITIKCEHCLSELRGKLVSWPGGTVTAQVEPCGHCMNIARIEADGEGYRRGFDSGFNRKPNSVVAA